MWLVWPHVAVNCRCFRKPWAAPCVEQFEPDCLVVKPPRVNDWAVSQRVTWCKSYIIWMRKMISLPVFWQRITWRHVLDPFITWAPTYWFIEQPMTLIVMGLQRHNKFPNPNPIICGARGYHWKRKSTHHGVNNLEVSTKKPWYVMGEICLTHNILHGFLVSEVKCLSHQSSVLRLTHEPCTMSHGASIVWATRIHVPCVLLHMFASQTCQILGTFLHFLGMNLCVCVHMYI